MRQIFAATLLTKQIFMFTSEEERLYFEADYPNFENIDLRHRDPNFNRGDSRQYSRCSKNTILNSKIMIFINHKFNYLCLDCDKGISQLNPIITDFLNQHNIVYFTTVGSWTEGKPKDSATLCIKYKNYNDKIRLKLNKLFIVISRLPNGEMSCDPLAIGDQMKSVFTNQMKSQFYNLNGGNVYDLEELTDIAYAHFGKNWDEVKRLANQYRSEAYYQKYKVMMQNDFDDISFSKLVNYYQNMSKHNYDNWLFDKKVIDNEFNTIIEKYKSLPLEKKIKIADKRTLLRDYILINWCKYDGYAEDLKIFADRLKAKFKITSKRQIYKIAKDKEIEVLNTSHKYIDFVSLIGGDGLIAIKAKLNECRTKSRNRYLPTKKHKEHKNKEKITYYKIEKNGKTKTVKSKDRSAYLNRGWIVVED